ncbi:unnamed protein product [Trypanosoma congolense IL3000]|uniref:WGS project CAEQ00000000 data, annotated contig 481 n=1 Tax=Trypanosoma congolense (strain IL3000) TaxID=1068625 RepID=F9WGA6_TRYCI|nr:unnamed protein product [Trypanosoma congolense IL3000]
MPFCLQSHSNEHMPSSLCGYSIASLMPPTLTSWWPLTVCIMRSWLHNCLPNWTCSSDMPSGRSHNMPMGRSYLMPLWKLNPMAPVGGTHADMPPSIVQGICLHDIPSHTRMYEFSPRDSLHTSKRSLTTPQFPECRHRLMKVETLAVGSLSKRIRPYVWPSPCHAFHGASRTPLCYLLYLGQSIADVM